MSVIKCFNENCKYHDIEQPDNCCHPIVVRSECMDAILKKDGGRSKNWYYEQLMSNECLCGKPKKKGHSFCFVDYRMLPGYLQRHLYNRIGEGYEESFDEAVKYLQEHVW